MSRSSASQVLPSTLLELLGAFCARPTVAWERIEPSTCREMSRRLGAEEAVRVFKAEIHARLSEHGYVILKGLSSKAEPAALMGSFFGLVCALGEPTAHSWNGADVLWHVRPSPSAGTEPSRSRSPVALHTDSAFKERPERYFTLLALRNDGEGGESLLLDARLLLDDLSRDARGQRCLEFLSRAALPTLPPTMFGYPQELGYFKVLGGEPLIRFRYDLLQAGLERDGALAAEAEPELQHLERALMDSPHVVRYQLQAGEILLVDNHRQLHGRSGIVNAARHLVRIRFD